MTTQALKTQAPAFKEPVVDAALAQSFGVNASEYQTILTSLGRTPSYTELGIFSVMWSEHCSYKSSRNFLSRLPTEAPWVIEGPGENAGVIDIGDGQAAIFKMESHNHPSYIEPYQGAATGVGGIMRDVFTMGARPVANLNALRFGDPSHPRTRALVAGVVKGIGDYGNCMGVPTVGGEINFHASYNGNCLVNAMTVGIAATDQIFYSRGAGVGQPVVYVGSKTGRDGIHGATMSSAEFTEGQEDQRPTVQVGDPFVEKLLLEACLELMQRDAIISIQDMGAAGLTSSSVEIAAKGGIGITLTLDAVPMRESGMMPYEIMLSESQERMLMVLKTGRESEAMEIFKRWDLDCAVIGVTTANPDLRIEMYGQVWCDMPVAPLVDKAPRYNRPTAPSPQPPHLNAAHTALPAGGHADAIAQLIACPDIASKAWVTEQYDTLVGGHTRAGPAAADAAIVRVHPSGKALCLTSDCTPRYVRANPYSGGAQAVAESWRNIIACGGKPLAITNNLNFGNPEKPVIMGQFADAIEGIRAACLALDYPVVSGNVSLYNETNGQAIDPTPTIGGVGVLANMAHATTLDLKALDSVLLLVGCAGAHLGQSLYARTLFGGEAGDPPAVDFALERANGDFISHLIAAGHVRACHDISDGGLLVTLTEMALAARGDACGFDLSSSTAPHTAAYWFGEDQGRYVIEVAAIDESTITALAAAHKITLTRLGVPTTGDLVFADGTRSTQKALKALHTAWLPTYMNGGT